MATMKTQEVAVLLGKSGDQVRRDVHNGLLAATKVGKELLFDRDEVLRFAESRGIRTSQAQPEREVPQDDFFQAWVQAMKKAAPGTRMSFTAPPKTSVA